jgi:hypothetical protein
MSWMFRSEVAWLRLVILAVIVAGLVVAAADRTWVGVGLLSLLALFGLALALRRAAAEVATPVTAVPGSVRPAPPSTRSFVAVGTDATVLDATSEALERADDPRSARISIVVSPDEGRSTGSQDCAPESAPAESGLVEAMSRAADAGVRVSAQVGAIDPVASVRRLVETAEVDGIVLATGGPLSGSSLDLYRSLRELGVPVTHVQSST